MKSKSPLKAYKYNMTGAYANPQTVIQPILGAEVAKSVIGAASKLGSQLITKEVGSKAAKQALASKTFSDMAKSGQEESNKIKNSKVGGESIFKNDLSLKGLTGAVKPEIGEFSFLNPGKNPITSTKGSPVKHNTGAAEAGELAARQNNPFARMLKSNNVQQKLDAAKSQPRNSDFLVGGTAGIRQRIDRLKSQQRAAKSQQSSSGIFGIVAQAASQDGPVVGSIGQQMGNQAQQGAPDAGGSTGVDSFLPPPNQVAETGSYGGGGDRILEMDSNPVGNQSIGRDTDVASQLFGSGQRASMLAMKGTPLHTEGHGGAKGHTHAKPGDYLDQTVAEDMGVNDIEDYNPIQKFKGKQIVVNSQNKDTIFSQGSTFVNPKQMKGIKRSSEGTPKYKPVYINRNKKQ